MTSQIKITNWPQYVAAAVSTESRLQAINPSDIRLSHALFGLVTELKEYLDGQGKVNNIEELGDILWYLAVADDVVDFSTDSTTLLAEYPDDPWLIVADIADCLKRGIFYGKGYDFERLKNALRQMRAWVYDQIPDVVGVEEVFSAIHAHTRDVDRELEHIGKDGELLVKPYTLELGNIDELRDQATVESDILLLWEQLTTPGIELYNLTPEETDGLFVRPHAVKAKILAWLGCSAEQAAAVIGEPFTYSESRIHNVGDGIFHLKVVPYEPIVKEGLSPETIMETFFPINQVQLSYQGFNEVARSLLTLGQIEKMAMDLAFVRAQQYRKMGALDLARGYDAMYKSYSGKGDRLEDYSLAIMWQEAGYSLDEAQVRERLERWK